MKTKDEILSEMAIFRVNDGGLGAWLTNNTHTAVFERLGQIDTEPLPAVQFNQLLVLAHEAPVSDGFFRYYWLNNPPSHPYNVRDLPHFEKKWLTKDAIQSLEHLKWGLYRLYVDALLYFGNIRTAFRALREKSYEELTTFFAGKRFHTDRIKRRGPPLQLRKIDHDKRYLISEMACKSYGETPETSSRLKEALFDSFTRHLENNGLPIQVSGLLDRELPSKYLDYKAQLIFSANEILEETVTDKHELQILYDKISRKFTTAREDALANTEYYLSMLTDLDVYVATSMRTPKDFLEMAEICDTVFSDEALRSLNLRYFDPTLSAAKGHEDKGLIECLMVKCSEVLVYCAGEKESYGKDAEAAMALCLGKPVIFFCDEDQRKSFYRDVHPLSRLIEFDTGVAVGAMVTAEPAAIIELLRRIFENDMSYRLEQHPEQPGYLRLKEHLTDSVVRLQTNDDLLTETFWNHYHRSKDRERVDIGPDVKASPAKVATLHPSFSKKSTEPKEGGQQDLLLGEQGEQLLDLAARTSGQQYDEPRHEEWVQPTVDANVNDELLSNEELFNGISKIKLSKATGKKRFENLNRWLSEERITDSNDVIRFLRYIEATIEALKLPSNYVYRGSDLARWYHEMLNGSETGSKR